MSKSGGVFQIDDVTRTMSKGGGVRLVFHPSKFRPPPPTWLAGYGPGTSSVKTCTKEQYPLLTLTIPDDGCVEFMMSHLS